jgi:hypothetical protein
MMRRSRPETMLSDSVERKILKAKSDDSREQLRDELSTTAFQWAKADREDRREDAKELSERIDALKLKLVM